MTAARAVAYFLIAYLSLEFSDERRRALVKRLDLSLKLISAHGIMGHRELSLELSPSSGAAPDGSSTGRSPR